MNAMDPGLREELLAQGWVVRDSPEGPELVPAGP